MDTPDLEPIAKDAISWREGIRNGYTRAYIYFALMETGVLAALLAAGPRGKTVPALADECKVEPRLLKGVLDYLALADVTLTKEDDRFSVSRAGREVLSGESLTWLHVGLTTSIAAYGCVLTELVPALRGEKKYGVDFVRRGDAVAQVSHTASGESHPWIVSELARRNAKVIADLGCGSGELLIAFCRLDPSLQGIGIDIDPGALREAEKRIRTAGLEAQITLAQGDVGKPSSFARSCDKASAFSSVAVMHEFLRDGEEALVQIFREMRELFPERYFFLGEFEAWTDEQYRRLTIPERIPPIWYQHIMHPLSLQGLPISRDKWMGIFERAGVRLEERKEFFFDQYILRFERP